MKALLDLATHQRVVGLLALLISGLYVYFTPQITLDFWSESEPFNARTMPYLFGYGAMAVASLLIVLPGKAFGWSELKTLDYLPALGMCLALAGFSVAIDYLGFIATTTLFLSFGFWILGERLLIRLFSVALLISLAFYFGLTALGIYLSPGEIWLQYA